MALRGFARPGWAWLWLLGAVAGFALGPTAAWAEDQAAPPAAEEDADEPADEPTEEDAEARYRLPEEATAEELAAFVQGLREFQPESADEFFRHQRLLVPAIQAAAARILELEQDPASPLRRQAQGWVLEAGVRQLGEATLEQQQQTLEQFKAYLAGGEVTRRDFNLIRGVAMSLERSGGPGSASLAAEAYRTGAEALRKSGDEQLVAIADVLEGSARRIELPGNEMELTGKTLDGEEFDVADWKGKLVLVDFWATWCGPCVAEMPNMKELFEKHHADGFEIVGLSLDQNRGALEQFVADEEVPWTILHDAENEGRHPAATHYGVFAIPTMILIGRDGKVHALDLRGEELAAEVDRLMAEPAPSEAVGE